MGISHFAIPLLVCDLNFQICDSPGCPYCSARMAATTMERRAGPVLHCKWNDHIMTKHCVLLAGILERTQAKFRTQSMCKRYVQFFVCNLILQMLAEKHFLLLTSFASHNIKDREVLGLASFCTMYFPMSLYCWFSLLILVEQCVFPHWIFIRFS